VPIISVIIPVLNAATHLRAALVSLPGQNTDVEAVLVDGGSRDDTLAIAAAHPSLRVISAPGSSIYEALNRGIAETSAPAIVFLNADDALLPRAIEAWRDALVRVPECGIARGRPTFVESDRNGTLVPMARLNSRVAGPLTAEVLLRGPCAINSLCIRRSVFDSIGLFDTKYRLAADREWMLRAFRAGVGIAEFDSPVYRYLSHIGSSTIDRTRRNYAPMRREHLDIAARYLSTASPCHPMLLRVLRRWHAAETGMLAWHQVRAFDVSGVASTLAHATRLDALWPAFLVGDSVRWLLRR